MSMWQSAPLRELVAGADGVGIRPVLRAALPGEPWQSRPRTGRLLDRSALDDTAQVDRSQQSCRSDPKSRCDPFCAAIGVAACAALEKLNLAIVLLRSDCRVQFANQAAQRIAARRDCYLVKTQRLQLADQRSHRALEAFLGRQPFVGTEVESPHCISCRDDVVLRYFVFVEWLGGPLAHSGRTVALSIYEPYLAVNLSHELLARLYGLTRMESQLVAALFVQPVLQTAANHGGISLNTAKTHLKHVFAKCGVRSKAELLRLLALGPRTL